MTNYKTFEIIKKDSFSYPDANYIAFKTDSDITFQYGVRFNHIICINDYPFKGYEKGEYLEVDLDKVRNLDMMHPCDTSIVRKVSSSAVVSRSSNNIPTISRNEARGIVQNINEAIDSDERNEYEAKIHVDPNSGKYSGFSIIGRRK
jgi:hypothetical protein